MPNRFFNFSLGSIVGLSLGFFIYRSRRSWGSVKWLYLPFWGMLFGSWALAPDVLYALGLVSKNWAHGVWANIFFFHGALEQLEHTAPGLDKKLCVTGNFAWAFIYIGVTTGYVLFIAGLKKRIKAIKETKRY